MMQGSSISGGVGTPIYGAGSATSPSFAPRKSMQARALVGGSSTYTQARSLSPLPATRVHQTVSYPAVAGAASGHAVTYPAASSSVSRATSNFRGSSPIAPQGCSPIVRGRISSPNVPSPSVVRETSSGWAPAGSSAQQRSLLPGNLSYAGNPGHSSTPVGRCTEKQAVEATSTFAPQSPWELLSDERLLELAGKVLCGFVAPELIRELNRQDLVSLLAAHHHVAPSHVGDVSTNQANEGASSPSKPRPVRRSTSTPSGIDSRQTPSFPSPVPVSHTGGVLGPRREVRRDVSLQHAPGLVTARSQSPPCTVQRFSSVASGSTDQGVASSASMATQSTQLQPGIHMGVPEAAMDATTRACILSSSDSCEVSPKLPQRNSVSRMISSGTSRDAGHKRSDSPRRVVLRSQRASASRSVSPLPPQATRSGGRAAAALAANFPPPTPSKSGKGAAGEDDEMASSSVMSRSPSPLQKFAKGLSGRARPSWTRGGDMTHMLICALDYVGSASPLTCSMDGKNIQDLAKACGITNAETLLNEQCSKEAVLAAIRRTAQKCIPGDTFIFYFAGHAMPSVDLDGDALDRKGDNFVCDFTNQPLDPQKHYLSDDEFSSLLTQSLSTKVNVIVISDCCHYSNICDLQRQCWNGCQSVSISGCKASQIPGDLGKGSICTNSIMLAVEQIQKEGLTSYSVGHLYRKIVSFDNGIHARSQNIQIQKASGCNEDAINWPLVPIRPFSAPLSTASTLRSGATGKATRSGAHACNPATPPAPIAFSRPGTVSSAGGGPPPRTTSTKRFRLKQSHGARASSPSDRPPSEPPTPLSISDSGGTGRGCVNFSELVAVRRKVTSSPSMGRRRGESPSQSYRDTGREAAIDSSVTTLPPTWTRGDMEKPAATKDMGSWTASVYTPEQQQRLNVDERGNPRQAENGDRSEVAYPAPVKVGAGQKDDYRFEQPFRPLSRTSVGGGTTHMLICALDYVGSSSPLTCSTDGKNMHALALASGVMDVEALYNEECSKEAVTDAIFRTARKCTSGDTFLFFFAGHGMSSTDFDGDKKDGKDENYVCDFTNQSLDPQKHYLSDDEFSALITSYLGPRVDIIIVSDCCHSGSICDFDRQCWNGYNAVSISGCRDPQTSGDTGRGGICTHSIMLAIEQLQKEGQTSYSVGQLYRKTSFFDDTMMASLQDIKLDKTAGCNENSINWTLIPKGPFSAPYHSESGILSGAASKSYTPASPFVVTSSTPSTGLTSIGSPATVSFASLPHTEGLLPAERSGGFPGSLDWPQSIHQDRWLDDSRSSLSITDTEKIHPDQSLDTSMEGPSTRMDAVLAAKLAAADRQLSLAQGAAARLAASNPRHLGGSRSPSLIRWSSLPGGASAARVASPPPATFMTCSPPGNSQDYDQLLSAKMREIEAMRIQAEEDAAGRSSRHDQDLATPPLAIQSPFSSPVKTPKAEPRSPVGVLDADATRQVSSRSHSPQSGARTRRALDVSASQESVATLTPPTPRHTERMDPWLT